MTDAWSLAPEHAAELVTANAILVREGVLDAFGHISLRDPHRPDIFWLPTALPPSRVGMADFLAFDMEGEPVAPTAAPLFIERYIHAAVLRARPEVSAVCHHHAAALLPFCLTGLPLRAVSQTGGFLGAAVPFWDSADHFGPTPMLITDMAQATSMADALGAAALVLLRGHGAVVAGNSVRDVVFKAIYACREASALREAHGLGAVTPLSAGEIEKVGQPKAGILDRCWAHWTADLPSAPGPAPERTQP